MRLIKNSEAKEGMHVNGHIHGKPFEGRLSVTNGGDVFVHQSDVHVSMNGISQKPLYSHKYCWPCGDKKHPINASNWLAKNVTSTKDSSVRTKPEHLGYVWDGIKYTEHAIAGRRLEEHTERIEKKKRDLKDHNLRERAEIRGLVTQGKRHSKMVWK